MPYLQLDLPESYPAERKRALAHELGATYASIMKTTPGRVTVGFRELADGGLWHCGDGEPVPGALLMCDIRRGRPRAWREQLAIALLDLCSQHLGMARDRIAVDFTQHAGDEMYRADEGWAKDWHENETDPA